MNTVLKTKYKLHKFINIAFYLIFFAIGFLIGSGFNISELIENIKNFF